MVEWANLLPFREPSRKPHPRKTRAKTAGNTAPCCSLLPLSLPFSPALFFQGSQGLFLMFSVFVTKSVQHFSPSPSYHSQCPVFLGMPLAPSL